MKTPAILLIVVGIVIVVWGAFGFQTRDKVLDVGRSTLPGTRPTTCPTVLSPVPFLLSVALSCW